MSSKKLIVKGHELDGQQLEAVIDRSHTQLVIAGAGTGKTTTLVGKVRYLVESEGVDPSRILIISLTNNTVEDMKETIKGEFGPGFAADVMTIHALGNRIVRMRSCVGPVKNKLLGSIIYDLVETDRPRARALLSYVEGMRATTASDISLNGISIRNRGLRNISDVLFEVGIRCEYTRADYSSNQPTPAFIEATDPKGRKLKVIAESENAKNFAKDPAKAREYLGDMGFPTETMNINDLAANVLEAWGNRIPESIGSLISRCKNTGTAIADLKRANMRNPVTVRVPIEERLDLVDRVWDLYNMTCIQGNMADYDDMVIQATDVVRSGGYRGKRYEYVLVDEYQDVSRTLVGLLKALREAIGFDLFCVGDDWQSIYSFNGGDVWQMLEFSDIWHEWGEPSIRRIEVTYRSPQQIVEMTNRFVSKNPMQHRKDVRSCHVSDVPPVQLLSVNNDREIQRMVSNRLQFLDRDASVFIIGRGRNDVFALGNGSGQFSFSISDNRASGTVDVVFRNWDDEKGDWVEDRRLTYLTAHSSKGLEADYVFLIADRDRGGFPSTVADDIGDLFPRRDEGIPYPEERRVFYVAMTRAKRGLFIVNRMEDGYALSSLNPFTQELISDNGLLLTKSTPFCRECFGPMRLIGSGNGLFYGCCDYPNCKGTRPYKGF